MLEEKTEAAQFAVLKKYGVLADFSELEAAEIDQVLKLGVSKGDAPSLTLAQWCKGLIGSNRRVPVARFEAVPGQTQVSSLCIGTTLGTHFAELERKHKRNVACEREIHRLRSELAALEKRHEEEEQSWRNDLQRMHEELTQYKRAGGATPCATVLDESSGLNDVYFGMITRLQQTLGGVVDFNGSNYSGPYNKHCRDKLFEILAFAFKHFESLGLSFRVAVFESSSLYREASRICYQSEPDERYDYHHAMVLVIKDMPYEVFASPDQSNRVEGIRYDFHVDVAIDSAMELSFDDVQHLGKILHRLYEAIKRSGDNRPRGALREQIVLCLLLLITAPCMMPRRIEEGRARTFFDVRQGKVIKISDISITEVVMNMHSMRDKMLNVLNPVRISAY